MAADTVTATGAAELSIGLAADGIVGRGGTGSPVNPIAIL